MTPERHSYSYFLRSKSGYTVLDCKELLYCKADGRYSLLRLKSGTEYLQSKTLKSFMSEINCPWFVRISQSFAVNRLYIEQIIHKERRILLKNGEFIAFTITVRELCALLKSPPDTENRSRGRTT